MQIIMFSDLECDYINPIDLCNKLNQVHSPLRSPGNRLTAVLFALVRPPRKHRPRIPHRPLPPLRSMDSLLTKRTTSRLQR